MTHTQKSESLLPVLLVTCCGCYTAATPLLLLYMLAVVPYNRKVRTQLLLLYMTCIRTR